MLVLMTEILVIMDNGQKCHESKQTNHLGQKSNWVCFDWMTTCVSQLTKVSSLCFDRLD